ncbi:MAG: signal peptidase I [Rickettsiaceae bacterium]|nr:MAG: signal peptidase I [Rickettsiaceae bacterium]
MINKIRENYKSLNEWLSFLYVIIFAFAIRIFVMEIFFVPTGSMKLTILENDYIFSTKYSYGYSKHSIPYSLPIFTGRLFSSKPERGDVIIFRPPHKMHERFIKRLIGLPGDKIQLIEDIIYINDTPIIREKVGVIEDEQGIFHKKYKEILPNGLNYYSYKILHTNPIHDRLSNTQIFHVPEDQYFFLGDNRDNSDDSRMSLGFVPFENFISKAQCVAFSTKELLHLENGSIVQYVTRLWTWLSSVRINRIFKSMYGTD